MGRGKRPKDPERMRALALATAASSDDENTSCHCQNKCSQKRSAGAIFSHNSFGLLEVDMSSDADDDDFIADDQSTSSSSEAESHGSDIQEPTNVEVCLHCTGHGRLLTIKRSLNCFRPRQFQDVVMQHTIHVPRRRQRNSRRERNGQTPMSTLRHPSQREPVSWWTMLVTRY